MKSSGKRQGELLVEMGLLSAFEVYEMLQMQVGRKIQNSFLLAKAEISVEEGEDLLEGVPELPIDLFRNLLESFAMFAMESASRGLSRLAFSACLSASSFSPYHEYAKLITASAGARFGFNSSARLHSATAESNLFI